MSDITAKEIRRTFLKLIVKVPYKKVSVSAIAKECGINRNTFYNHYKDLPDLIEDIAKRKIKHYSENTECTESLDCIQEQIIADISAEKIAVLNIFKSANRELFEFYLWKICEFANCVYMEIAFKNRKLRDEDTNIIKRFFRTHFFGGIMHWLAKGLPKIDPQRIKRQNQLLEGIVEEMIIKAEKG